MMDAELLKILCCPETHQELRLADTARLGEVNLRITTGGAKNRAGRPVTEPLEGGLLRADGKFLYPIRNGIPVLLVDEALPF